MHVGVVEIQYGTVVEAFREKNKTKLNLPQKLMAF